MNNSTEVAEGRYIKGDPLRGYYDFIITEGSYKFWAAFQVFISLRLSLSLANAKHVCPHFGLFVTFFFI